MHQPDLNSLPATHIENWINPDQFTNQLMGPSTAKGRIVMGGVQQKQQWQQGMRPVLLQGDHQILQNSKVTSTPNKHWSVSVSCLMIKPQGMLSPNSIMLLFQPNKVKTNAYQNSGTYNKLIEPEQWNQASDLSGMNNLLKLLSNKNIKQKLGKGTASSQGSGGGNDKNVFK